MYRKKRAMFWGSSEEESKVVDTNGAINNNVVLQEGQPLNVFSYELIILLSIICLIRIIEFGYFVYRMNARRLKKKYTKNTISLQERQQRV